MRAYTFWLALWPIVQIATFRLVQRWGVSTPSPMYHHTVYRGIARAVPPVVRHCLKYNSQSLSHFKHFYLSRKLTI